MQTTLYKKIANAYNNGKMGPNIRERAFNWSTPTRGNKNSNQALKT